jgi:hypothetical protein
VIKVIGDAGENFMPECRDVENRGKMQLKKRETTRTAFGRKRGNFPAVQLAIDFCQQGNCACF